MPLLQGLDKFLLNGAIGGGENIFNTDLILYPNGAGEGTAVTERLNVTGSGWFLGANNTYGSGNYITVVIDGVMFYPTSGTSTSSSFGTNDFVNIPARFETSLVVSTAYNNQSIPYLLD